MIARYKHSILFGLIVSNKGNKFYNIDTWGLCYKTNYRGNLPWSDGKTLILCYKKKFTLVSR